MKPPDLQKVKTVDTKKYGGEALRNNYKSKILLK